MRRNSVFPAYRWRLLTDLQDGAIRKAHAAGVPIPALAAEYGVHKRTIYRALGRAVTETHVDVRVGDWHARFALTDDGPVQTTPWYPVAASLDVAS